MRRRRGVAALEFALFLPFLAMIAAAGIDWAWYFARSQDVTHLTADAARLGALTDDTSAAEAHAAFVLEAAGFDAGDITADATVVIEPTSGLELMEVTVDVTFTAMTGFLPTPATIQARAAFPVYAQ